MKHHQITASMAKDIAFKLGAVLDDEEAGIFADGYNVALLQSKYRDLSQPVDPQIAEYEKIMGQAGNSPVIPEGSFSGLVNSARALLDVLYEFGADEVAISEYVTNLEDALRVAAAPQQEVK